MSRLTVCLGLSLVTATGCSMIPGLGKKPGLATVAPATSPASAATADVAPPALVSDGGKVAKLYASWSYVDAAKAAEDRVQAWELVVGKITEDEFVNAPNPDPTFIATWRKGEGIHAIFDARVALQAAALRTWSVACSKTYEAWRAADAKIAGVHRAELDALAKEPNWYAATAGFAALGQAVAAEREAAGLNAPNDSGRAIRGDVGFGWEVAAAAIAYHNASSHGYLGLLAAAALTDGVASHAYEAGRPLTTDAAFEQASFCAAAAEHGATGLPPLPYSGDGPTLKAITWPAFLTDDGGKVLATREAELRATAAAKLATTELARVPTLSMNEGLEYTEATKTAAFDELRVVKAGDALVLTREDRVPFEYGCKKGKVTGIDDDGDLEYEMKGCKRAVNVFTTELTATLAELPPGYQPQVGDVMSFFATVTADASATKARKDTGRDVTRTMQAAITHLRKVTRGDRPAM